jgi:hypothetical protein
MTPNCNPMQPRFDRAQQTWGSKALRGIESGQRCFWWVSPWAPFSSAIVALMDLHTNCLHGRYLVGTCMHDVGHGHRVSGVTCPPYNGEYHEAGRRLSCWVCMAGCMHGGHASPSCIPPHGTCPYNTRFIQHAPLLGPGFPDIDLFLTPE